MDKYQFMLSLVSLALGGVIVTSIIATIGKIFARRRDGGSLGDDSTARLDERLARIEQAIDAMALEMERVSEGQRFATKLLSDRAPERART
ncbi:MAG: hypothetical protein Q8K82_00495 [Gemmatimonadaceae bacterium]|nr:hypothetical protein [Gemmatimonadaceae bacterium]